MVLVHPLGGRHADVRSRGVAQARPPEIEQFDAEARIGPGPGEERHFVPTRSQPVGETPDVGLQPAGERFDDREARGRDDRDPERPHRSTRE